MQLLKKLAAGEPGRLSALGDSLTYGYLVRQGYLDMVEAALRSQYPESQLTVLNHGVCGDTVFDGLSRFDEAFVYPQPDLGLIEFGLNDCFQGITPERFAAGLEQLVDLCRQRVPAMELVILPPIPVQPAAFQAAAEPFKKACFDIARQGPYPCVDFATPWRAADNLPLWQGDGVHPTEAGYRIMAQAVLATLSFPS